MSVISAVEERQFRMSRLRSAANEDISFFLHRLIFRFRHRLYIRSHLLQTLCARGSAVARFQERFNQIAAHYGINIPISGVYDDDTRHAVACIQKEALYVLDSDGFVGPETARLLRIKLVEG